MGTKADYQLRALKLISENKLLLNLLYQTLIVTCLRVDTRKFDAQNREPFKAILKLLVDKGLIKEDECEL